MVQRLVKALAPVQEITFPETDTMPLRHGGLPVIPVWGRGYSGILAANWLVRLAIMMYSTPGGIKGPCLNK